MLPPDDDNQDNVTGSDPGPGEAEIRAVLARIPVDFYERLAPLLQLCAVANFLLLGRPEDPAPQAIFQLTGFDLAAAARISRLRDSESLGRLLLEEPEMLYDFLLVGQLVFESSLFDEVRQLLDTPDASDSAAMAESMRAFVVELSEAILASLAQYLIQEHTDLSQGLNLRRLQLESIFARLSDTLVATQVPSAATNLSSVSLESTTICLRITLSAPQLAALWLALTFPEELADGPEQPLMQAIAAVPQQHSSAALQQRLHVFGPDDELSLTLSEVAALYQAAQLCALLLVSGSFDIPDAGSELQPDSLAILLQHCAELEHFVQLVQAKFPDEPVLLAVRHRVETLAEFL
jgi:hypothetical protein